MTHSAPRRLAAIGVAVAASALLAGCVSTGGTAPAASSGEDAAGSLILQSRFTDAEKGGIEELVDAFNKRGEGTVELNSVATSTFNSQLPTYLTSAQPAGRLHLVRRLGRPRLRRRRTCCSTSPTSGTAWRTTRRRCRRCAPTACGKKIFVPTSYYWWGMFYRKSNFAKWGVTPAEDLGRVPRGLRQAQGARASPRSASGLGDTPWVASAWFDYLEHPHQRRAVPPRTARGRAALRRPQGARRSSTRWARCCRTSTRSGASVPFQDRRRRDCSQGKTGMLLIGTFFADAVPEGRAWTTSTSSSSRSSTRRCRSPRRRRPTASSPASKTTKPDGVTKTLPRATLATPEAQEIYVKGSSGTALAREPGREATPTRRWSSKGKAMLERAEEVTQFFNRDSSDALQPTADTALTQFLAKPDADRPHPDRAGRRRREGLERVT